MLALVRTMLALIKDYARFVVESAFPVEISFEAFLVMLSPKGVTGPLKRKIDPD